MSTANDIAPLVEQGRLLHVVPDLPGLSVVRDVFATQSVYEFLTDEDAIPAQYARVSGRAKAKIDHFISGGVVTFALDPQDKARTSFIARNDPVEMGIVDVRITDPKPMIRIFGGFAARNILVLIVWHPREGLHFQQAVIDCRREWNSLFNNSAPLIGDTHECYLTGHFEIG
ncbi:hypothetical protein [Nitratireductor rhodophyticola]|uniref:hypothetical protein n=1 Tax=Nitratireductor rhodophyticola TaxID=2854036 RepID=UPI00300ACF99